jgi:hypothetical protein
LCGKVKILARDVSDSAPMWRKAKGGGGNLISLQRTILPLSDTLESVSMYTISISLDRSDGAIFDESLIT